MGVSGNSVAGKSFQMFTVSEELLAKVVEAVQAGEKQARSSGNTQSLEVFCHGFRQNISLGRVYIVPPAVCNDRKDFPTSLLHGALIRVFGWGGEEIADLIEKRIGESEFDEYSQADFDTIKKDLFVDPRTGKEACLIVFAPNWMNTREWITFHFTKDANELKNNLRHQVFSAYYDPRVSSAFNAMMTNVNTTKVDVTDITPKIPFPALAENLLKQYPLLVKQASGKKTILLNRKTADAITKETLDPQELDVFDSLNQALENSLLPDADGAQGEGGYKAPEATPGVPRAASNDDDPQDFHDKMEGRGSKKKPDQDEQEAHMASEDENPPAAHETPFTNVGPGTEAHDAQKDMVPAMKESVETEKASEEAGSPIGIAIDETGVPRSKVEEKKANAKDNPKTNKHDMSHPETLRVGQERLSSQVSAVFNGGFVRKDWVPQTLAGYLDKELGDNAAYAPHAAADHEKEIAAGLYGDTPFDRRAQKKWGSVDIKKVAKEVIPDFIAEHIASEVDEPSEAMSTKAKQARAKKESLLDKYRPKTAVELDIDSIWDSITEDMGPAPLVDVDSSAPSQNSDGHSDEAPEGNEFFSGGRPNKKDVADLPEAFKSDEPEDDKAISDNEAETQETDLENEPTREEEHHEAGWRIDEKFADFVEEVAEDYDEDEGRERLSCDQCEMLAINGVPCHERGCPNMGARWDSERGEWVKQRECFECGMDVDYDDPCCSAPPEDDDQGPATFGEQEMEASVESAGADYVGDNAGLAQKEADTSMSKCSCEWSGCPHCGGHGCSATAQNLVELYGTKTRLCDGCFDAEDVDANGDMVLIQRLASNKKATPKAAGGLAEKIELLDDDIWMKLGIESGDQLMPEYGGDPQLYERYKQEVLAALAKAGIKQVPTKVIRQLENDNFHRINKVIMEAGLGKYASKKKADTRDNPYNMKDGQGAPENAKNVSVDDTTGPTPVNTKQAAKPKVAEWKGWNEQMPVQVVGTPAGSEEFANLAEAKKKYPTLDPMKNTNDFTWAMHGMIGGQDAIRFETWEAYRMLSASLKPKNADDVSGDFSEAKSETVSPDTVDKDIQQPTVSVEEAGKQARLKIALRYMNSYDIEEAVAVLGRDPVLGKAARFLKEFKEEVDSHSDGWAYWRPPVAAAARLMQIIQHAVAKARGYASADAEANIDISEQAIAKAMAPIKAFMTRRGNAAGMKMPVLAADISGDMSEAKSELDYNKAEMADEPKATDTVNPEHFACRHDDVPVAQGEAADDKQPKSDLSGAAPEAHDVPPQVDSKQAAYGDQSPEEAAFDFGAGDLADIVMTEDTDEPEAE
jgi:hypothetical protein